MSVTASESIVSGLGDLVSASTAQPFWTTALSGILASLPGLLAVVVGWYVIHKQTLAAQDRMFVNALQNDARKDIVGALRAYQAMLLALYTTLSEFASHTVIKVDEARAFRRSLNPLMYDPRGLDWIHRLQEYELLYPETKLISRELARRHATLTKESLSFANDVKAECETGGRTELTLPEEVARAAKVANQLGLVRDLGLHIQNRALSGILRTAAPSLPKNPTGDSLRLDAQGKLEIVAGPPPQVPGVSTAT